MSTDTPPPEPAIKAAYYAQGIFVPDAYTVEQFLARDAQWRQRVAELEADARRYRWLRDEHIVWKPPKYDGCPHGRFDMVWPNECRDLDAAIDSSLGEEKKA